MTQNYWRMALSDKFRNKRRRQDHSHPEIQQHKRKKDASQPEGQAEDRWGVKNYLPEVASCKVEPMAQSWMKAEILSSTATIGCCLMPYPGCGLAIYDKVRCYLLTIISIIITINPQCAMKSK